MSVSLIRDLPIDFMSITKFGAIGVILLNNEKTISWTKSYWDALHPYSAGGAYVNFMMDEGEERVKATYGDNYKRLVEIKNKYDPENLFRVNQNIRPRNNK